MYPQFGLKIWATDIDLLEQAATLMKDGTFQFVEVAVVPGTPIEPFKSYPMPYVIHCPSDRFGFNIADPARFKANERMLDEAIDWTSTLGSNIIVLHPGHGRLRHAIDFLRDIDCPGITIENMPCAGLNGEHMIGYDKEQLVQLLDGRFGFCLDFTHAAKAAASLGRGYDEFLVGLTTLKPSLYHLSGYHPGAGADEHLDIDAGGHDLVFLHELIKNNKVVPSITFETPRAGRSLAADVYNKEVLVKAWQ